jgi:hypothetical protein
MYTAVPMAISPMVSHTYNGDASGRRIDNPPIPPIIQPKRERGQEPPADLLVIFWLSGHFRVLGRAPTTASRLLSLGLPQSPMRNCRNGRPEKVDQVVRTLPFHQRSIRFVCLVKALSRCSPVLLKNGSRRKRSCFGSGFGAILHLATGNI